MTENNERNPRATLEHSASRRRVTVAPSSHPRTHLFSPSHTHTYMYILPHTSKKPTPKLFSRGRVAGKCITFAPPFFVPLFASEKLFALCVYISSSCAAFFLCRSLGEFSRGSLFCHRGGCCKSVDEYYECYSEDEGFLYSVSEFAQLFGAGNGCWQCN